MEKPETQHSPEPWSVDPNKLFYVYDAKGRRVAMPSYTMNGADGLSWGARDSEEIAANAHLIAAAPDLLRALEAAIRCIDSRIELVEYSHELPPEPASEWDQDAVALIGFARAAIAKAKGSE